MMNVEIGYVDAVDIPEDATLNISDDIDELGASIELGRDLPGNTIHIELRNSEKRYVSFYIDKDELKRALRVF